LTINARTAQHRHSSQFSFDFSTSPRGGNVTGDQNRGSLKETAISMTSIEFTLQNDEVNIAMIVESQERDAVVQIRNPHRHLNPAKLHKEFIELSLIYMVMSFR
jgi:hypothetical protein